MFKDSFDMNTRQKFDLALKQYLINKKQPCFNNVIPTATDFSTERPAYLINENCFKLNETFSENLSREIKRKYFYNIGSSSRFLCASIQNYPGLEDLQPEDILKNSKIIKPHIDATFKKNGYKYYLEAKCHEIFDSHKKVKFSDSYLNNDFFEKFIIELNLASGTIKKEWMNLTTLNFGINRKTTHFDFKQFICHLIGITYDEPDKNKRFVYFIYRNKKIEDFEKYYDELLKEMSLINDRFSPYLKKHNIELMYIFHNQFDTIQDFETNLKSFDSIK